MNRIIFLIASLFLFCTSMVSAQEVNKSDLHKRAEAVDPKENIATARSLYIHAFNDYYNHGQMRQGVECATKAASLYYSRENYYKEAFDLLRRADDAINSSEKDSQADKAAMHYLVTKERLQMYIKLRKGESAKEQLNIMESQASQSNDENLKNDLLYTKAIYYYTFGQNAQGNAVFKEMADKLTASKEECRNTVAGGIHCRHVKDRTIAAFRKSYETYWLSFLSLLSKVEHHLVWS